jgi:hypothetical protein
VLAGAAERCHAAEGLFVGHHCRWFIATTRQRADVSAR